MAEETPARYFEAGKLPADLLRQLLREIPLTDDRVVLGPGVGIDAAAIRFGDRVLVVKSDPITFTADDLGWYAIHVNANDIACLGGTPKWFLATLLLPEKQTVLTGDNIYPPRCLYRSGTVHRRKGNLSRNRPLG